MPVDSYRPRTSLATHEVANQPDALVGANLYADDRLLAALAAPRVEPAHRDRLVAFGARVGSAEVLQWGEQANASPPVLRTFDRVGRRIDEVDFHPAYHELMRLSIEAGASAIAWSAPAGGHLSHSLLLFLLTQADAGHGCPVSMTYASVPALRHEPDVAARWEPRVTSARYDPRCLPPEMKDGCTLGMAMTEKQGGSDLRAITTRAERDGVRWRLTGHKWFCSAPMSDAFLSLAQTPAGLSCFLVPRWPASGRNRIRLQRLKEKLGNRSNATAEIEYEGAEAILVGREGEGLQKILAMVHETRLDTALAPAGLMRAALDEALWWARARHAFGRPLVAQPLMAALLADLALDQIAALALGLRVARDFRAPAPEARAFCRLGVALAKFLANKLAVPVIGEAMECLGGMGYIDDTPLPLLYREAPLNGIWEGSGNVIALDARRTLARTPLAATQLLAELEQAAGLCADYDRALEEARPLSAGVEFPEERAREAAWRLATLLAAAQLLRHAPREIALAYCRTRLADPRPLYGCRHGLPVEAILDWFTAAPESGTV